MRPFVLLALLLPLFSISPARAQPLIADMSDHIIALTTGFAGADLMLYGAVDDDGDVVVVIRGPDETAMVRKKERVSGIWINHGEQAFENVPQFYAIAASRPIDEIVSDNERERLEIGVENLSVNPADTASGDQMQVYWEALIRNKRRVGLFPETSGEVYFLGKRLFRSDFHFPANVHTGFYNVTVYLFRHGRVVSAQSTPLKVSKIGLGAGVFRFAHEYSAVHGIAAILIALFFGWFAGVLFRRG